MMESNTNTLLNMNMMGPPVFQQQPQQQTLATCITNPGLAPPSLPIVKKNITVEVSGSKFCIVPSLFQSIEKLNWKKSNR